MGGLGGALTSTLFCSCSTLSLPGALLAGLDLGLTTAVGTKEGFPDWDYDAQPHVLAPVQHSADVTVVATQAC